MENEKMEIMHEALSDEKLNAVSGGRQASDYDRRVYRIGDECIFCGLCLDNCTMGCITASERNYSIDEDCCIGCGACAGLCPTGTIQEIYL